MRPLGGNHIMRKSQHLASFRNSITTRLDGGQAAHPDRPGISPSPSSSKQSSWTSWAGQKIKQIAQTVTPDSDRRGGSSVENIYVFPGWASRRYHDMDNSALRGTAATSSCVLWTELDRPVA
jgi:hypothetical protein